MWTDCCESDKSSDQYLSTWEDVTEGRTEELSCETWSSLLDEQRASYNSRFFTKYDELLNLPIFKESQLQIYTYMYNCKHICEYMHSLFPRVLYTVWCLSKLYTDIIFVKAACKCFQIGTSVRALVFNAGLLARSQFASGRSCDRPSRSRFYVVFLGPRANAELVPKFHVALHASHAALPMVT
jgi:hypothetical protein